jgi:putative DNA primase/helicase
MTPKPLKIAYDAPNTPATEPSAPQALPAVPQSASQQPHAGILVNAADLTLSLVEWLWNKWLPRGKLTLLAGSPGTGKTTMAMHMAAVVSKGGAWPDAGSARPGRVLIWSAEDGVRDTLLPRLMAAEANLPNIFFVRDDTVAGDDFSFDPAHHMQALTEELTKSGPFALIILDPLVAISRGDSHKNSEVRKDLNPVLDLARRANCAVLGITHLSKATSHLPPQERLNGSIAFVAVARSVLIAAKTRAELPSTHILVSVKNNLSERPDSIEYSIQPAQVPAEGGVIDTSRLGWGRTVPGEPEDILRPSEGEGVNRPTALAQAMTFLQEMLADGPASADSVKNQAVAEGHSQRTLQRAEKALGVKHHKDGMEGGWLWSLPSLMAHEDGQN